MDQTFSCTTCGGPNEPVPGASRMACAYCGATLTIPQEMRLKAKPLTEKIPHKKEPAIRLEQDAPDLLRKAQPIAIKAWNVYAYWTWIRRLFPACLIVFLIGLLICLAFGALPLVIGLFR